MPFLFSFLPRPLPCGSGARRRAAHRPFAPTPVPVLPGFHQVCPTAIPIRTRHLRELPRRSCSGDRDARVRGPSDGRCHLPSVRGTFPCFSSPVHALRRVHADVVPVLGALWTSAVAGASPRGEEPVLVAGPNQDLRSDAVPRRPTPSRRPGCLPPLRPHRAFDRRIAPPTESRASVPRSRRPHFFPRVGRVLYGPCKRQSAVTRDPWHSRNKPPFLPMGSFLSELSCLGLTTQARPSARPSWLVCES
jgi:hypothetical protein